MYDEEPWVIEQSAAEFGIQYVDVTVTDTGISGMEMADKLRKLDFSELSHIYDYDTVAEVYEHYTFDEIVRRYKTASIVSLGDIIKHISSDREFVITRINSSANSVSGFYRDTGDVATVSDFSGWTATFGTIDLGKILITS